MTLLQSVTAKEGQLERNSVGLHLFIHALQAGQLAEELRMAKTQHSSSSAPYSSATRDGKPCH